jgi:hypothetical protein
MAAPPQAMRASTMDGCRQRAAEARAAGRVRGVVSPKKLARSEGASAAEARVG